MIDGTKILNLPVIIEELLNNRYVSFPIHVNEKDGEILDYTRFAEYKDLTFSIKNNNVKLNGSLHKYHNNGIHNYNDFHFSELIDVINDISTKFSIPIERTYLNNIEFGVNIEIPFTTDELFKSIICYKETPFQKFNIIGAKGIECERPKFIIKLYDKGFQNDLTSNLLRFEIKVIKMQFLKQKNVKIQTLHDLLNINELNKLKTILADVWNDILFYDYSINETDLNARERLILSNGRNPKYWENMHPDSKNFIGGATDDEYKKQRKKYYRDMDNYKKCLSVHSSSNIQKNISELIIRKCDELLFINNEIRDKCTDVLNFKSKRTANENEIRDKCTDVLNYVKNGKKGQMYILDIKDICPIAPVVKKRVCLNCNKDISQKSINAKYCSKKCKNDYTNPLLNPRNNLINRIAKLNRHTKLFADEEFYFFTSVQLDLLNNINTINRL